MTQVVFLKKSHLPTKAELEGSIRKFGYGFAIVDEFDNWYGHEGLSCTINGHETYFDLYVNEPAEVVRVYDWIKPDLGDQDTAISFIWGADFAAGACIGLISIALIDHCNALVYYLDDEMKYSREMLVDDTPQFLNELEERRTVQRQDQTKSVVELGDKDRRKGFWDRLKDMFK